MIACRSLALAVLLAAASGAVASDWLRNFEVACRQSGGTPVHNPGGGGYCQPGAGAPGGGGMGGNPYMPGITDALNSLWAAEARNDAASKQRRAALIQAIENERQNALARQQRAYANSLAAIQQRLAAMGGGLQPKFGRADIDTKPSEYGLPGRHVFRNDIFTGGNIDETEKIALTLKLGPDATASLRSSQGPATSAAAGTPQQQQANKARAEITQIMEKLTPEEQQRLQALLKNSTGSAPAAAASGAVAAPPPEAKTAETKPRDPQLSRKLAEAQKEADALRSAAAEDTAATPEELKHRAQMQVTRPAEAALRNPAPTMSSRVSAASQAGQPTAKPPFRRPSNEPNEVKPPSASPRPTQARSTVTAPPESGQLTHSLPQVAWQTAPTAAPPTRPADIALAGAVQEWGAAAPELNNPAHHRYALITHLAPDLMDRYRKDPGLRTQMDEFIDKRIQEARRARAIADLAAQESAYSAAAKLGQRFTPAGQQFDLDALKRNPDYARERARLIQANDEALEANARAAEDQLRRNLEMGFAGFRN